MPVGQFLLFIRNLRREDLDREKTRLMLIAFSATFLCVGPLHASSKGGLPKCENSLKETTANLLTCSNDLSTCNGDLSTCNGDLSTCKNDLSIAQLCGNDVIDSGEQCDQGNLNGQTCASQGFVGGTLKCGANCQFDTTGCTNNPLCRQRGRHDHRQQDRFDVGEEELHRRRARREQHVDVGGNPTQPFDGTAFTVFLPLLNNGTSRDGGATTPITGCFANHCDWRLPSIVELQEIVDTSAPGCGSGSACIDPIFGPTQSNFYWSATNQNLPFSIYAWGVNFNGGSVGYTFKVLGYYVRAVRSGS